jgi:hypothetical protein
MFPLNRSIPCIVSQFASCSFLPTNHFSPSNRTTFTTHLFAVVTLTWGGVQAFAAPVRFDWSHPHHWDLSINGFVQLNDATAAEAFPLQPLEGA